MLSHVADIVFLQQDLASVQPEGASDSVKQCGLSGSIGTDEGDKFTYNKGKAYIIQCYMFVRRPC
jgi:hypothetical protein